MFALDLFAQHSLCGMDIMCVICADRRDVDVLLSSVLLSLAVGPSTLPE
jgi:hypothetical protein